MKLICDRFVHVYDEASIAVITWMFDTDSVKSSMLGESRVGYVRDKRFDDNKDRWTLLFEIQDDVGTACQ